MAKKKKRRINSTALLIVAIASCCLIAGCYLFGTDKPVSPPPKPPAPPAAKRIDYRQAADDIMSRIDESLAAGKVKVTQTSRTEKSRDYKGGSAIWTERSQLLELGSSFSIEELSEQINKRLQGRNARLAPLEQAAWNGRAAERLDIVLEEKLAGESINLIIDRLYLIPGGKTAPPPTAGRSGKLAIVIDDCGYDINIVNKMTALRQKLSFAVLPNRDFSSAALRRINERGKEALLHLPMEPLNSGQQSEKTTITVNMPDEEIKKVTRDALADLPEVTGVNNHQGSRATADERVMRAMLSTLQKQRLFFLDSNTQPKTIAHKVAGRMGLKTGINRAFLDGEANVEYIKKRMRQAGESALKEGSYIAICHARPHTATALAEMVGELEGMGVEFVFVSSLLK